MSKNRHTKQKSYVRLTLVERKEIQDSLSKRGSCTLRSLADVLSRSISTVYDEVKRNRIVAKGPHKGQVLDVLPEDVCRRLKGWPFVCNGCKYFYYHCRKPLQLEYRAFSADRQVHAVLASSREGIDSTREDFEYIWSCTKDGISRGLSPEQIILAYALCVAPSTLYRWIDTYADTGLCNLHLRRQVKYKKRVHVCAPKSTSHGPERSYKAFLELDKEIQSAVCEMDTVIGRIHDKACLLTLYLRPCKFQLVFLIPSKTTEEVAHMFDELERLLGRAYFLRLFGYVLTDNGVEFSNHTLLERSALDAYTNRMKLYFCDVRQSQQKGACEKNHVEIRKALPKGTSFEGLTQRQCALLMSHINSEPRPSLGGLSAIQMFKFAYKDAADALLLGLGIEEVDKDHLNLTESLLQR